MASLEGKLYQLIISRLDGEEISTASCRDRAFGLVQKGIGGFIVFGGEREGLRSFIQELQAASETPLFIASDIERGVGQQAEGATNFPSQMAVAAAIGKDRTKDAGLLTDTIRAVAEEALYTGINMPLIPVLDVNTNPDNPIICTRAFSDDPEEVAWFGRAYIRTLEDSGLLSCAKHFPGHGDTSTDSHISLPVISKPLNELMDTDILPFREAVREGVSSMMVGHLSVPEADSQPATISKKIITGLLREELGYEGLVLTDALNMHALRDVGDLYRKCLEAGADILLHPEDADSAVAELKHALESGSLSEDRVDDAVGRVLEGKSAIKDIRGAEPDYGRHRELSEQVSDRSVTLVKATPGLLPVTEDNRLSVVIAGERNEFETSPLASLPPDPSRYVYMGERETAKAILEKTRGETVVIAVFTSVAAWKGSSGVGEREKALLRELIRKSRKSLVLSFGSPYVLRHFTEADGLAAAYDCSVQAQRSVIKCLTGEMEFNGSLPVELSLT